MVSSSVTLCDPVLKIGDLFDKAIDPIPGWCAEMEEAGAVPLLRAMRRGPA